MRGVIVLIGLTCAAMCCVNTILMMTPFGVVVGFIGLAACLGAIVFNLAVSVEVGNE
jgi:type IV secretory pathway TrbD component